MTPSCLTAGGSTLTVSPGYADAVSAVAEAHAGPGYAETIGAAARAVADCVDGAMTEGAAALAVAHPDEGALTEAGTVTSMTPEEMAAEIMAKNDAVQMIADSNRDDDSPIRKDIENRCDKEDRKIEPPVYEEEVPVYVPEEEVIVVETPSTGSGTMALTALSSVFGAAAAAFAVGAVAIRNRNGASFAAITLNSDLAGTSTNPSSRTAGGSPPAVFHRPRSSEQTTSVLDCVPVTTARAGRCDLPPRAPRGSIPSWRCRTWCVAQTESPRCRA